MRLLPLLSLPLVLGLVACGGDSPQPPAADPPAAEAPAPEAPDTPALATAELAPLFGSWGFDAPTCSSPIAISETAFQGAENSCEITGFAANGDGSYTATLACSSQGQTANERIAMTPLFGPLGEGVRLNYLDRGGEPVTVFRCREN